MADEAPMTYEQLTEVWRGLLVAEDYIVVPEGFDDAGQNPRTLLKRARTLIEDAMQRASTGSRGFREL